MSTLDRAVKNATIDFIEAYHTAMGDFPGRSQITHAIQLVLKKPPTPKEVDEFLENDETIKSLDERGIVPPWSLKFNPTGLTTEQLAVVAVLNNPKDRRSDSKKLNDLGISNRKFAGWSHDKIFSAYMKKSANNLLENMEAEAHMGLLSAVRNNNLPAIKLYFEMTGRYNPAYENQVNLQQLMVRVIEIIEKHVQDPEALMGIAADLQLASVENGITSIETVKPKTAIEPVKSSRPPVEDLFNEPERRLKF
jgi:hypothetical protein